MGVLDLRWGFHRACALRSRPPFFGNTFAPAAPKELDPRAGLKPTLCCLPDVCGSRTGPMLVPFSTTWRFVSRAVHRLFQPCGSAHRETHQALIPALKDEASRTIIGESKILTHSLPMLACGLIGSCSWDAQNPTSQPSSLPAFQPSSLPAFTTMRTPGFCRREQRICKDVRFFAAAPQE